MISLITCDVTKLRLCRDDIKSRHINTNSVDVLLKRNGIVEGCRNVGLDGK